MKTQMIQNKNGKISIILNKNKSIRVENRKQQYVLNKDIYHKIEQEFASFVGLETIKQTIKEIYATKIVNAKRKQVGLHGNKQVLHMLFKGNPGTGKTTIARKLAKLLFEMDILSKGHLTEVDRADLVGEYIGQTAQKTKSIVEKAMGGILFVDEAYSLARGGEKDFGREAIDILVKYMEDNSDHFVLILAGYPYEMEYFLSLNPGLKSRFPFIIEFSDYNMSQLIEIADKIAKEKEYELTLEAKEKLRSFLIDQQVHRHRDFSNARYIRNLIEYAIRMQAVRLINREHINTNDLIQLTSDDLHFEKMIN